MNTMQDIKSTCTSLSSLLHAIRDKKLEVKDFQVEESLIGDAMALFAQLSGQHHNIIKQQDIEADRSSELREKCEEAHDILEEQVVYMKYVDKEYDIRPWKASGGLVAVSPTDDHHMIKSKLDTELQGRRKMCEYGNTLEEEVASLRKAEDEMRSELERVRMDMSTMTTAPFLSGIAPCESFNTPASLPAPLFTFHQLVSATLREFKLQDIQFDVSETDPLKSKNSMYNGRQSLSTETWSLLKPVPQMLVLTIKKKNRVIFRYHDKINVVSCDYSYGDGILDMLVSGDHGTIAPHTSLNFTFTNPNITALVNSHHIGRLYCWLQELCGLDVVTERQHKPQDIRTVTPTQLINFIMEL